MGRNSSGGGGHGGGGGGVGGPQAPPIDLYRRHIGRQDSRKERKHLKSVQREHEAKENAPKALQQAVRFKR